MSSPKESPRNGKKSSYFMENVGTFTLCSAREIRCLLSSLLFIFIMMVSSTINQEKKKILQIGREEIKLYFLFFLVC
jgi:hypothetical protein